MVSSRHERVDKEPHHQIVLEIPERVAAAVPKQTTDSYS